MRNVNKEIALQMLDEMPENKKEQLRKTLSRNFYLTSVRNMEHGTFYVYKEGFYLRLEGCRCSFSIWAYDNDGELEFASRKPRENKLSKIYDEHLSFNEDDFDRI